MRPIWQVGLKRPAGLACILLAGREIAGLSDEETVDLVTGRIAN